MLRFAVLAVVALGCSSNSFDIAAESDSAVADTSVASDGSASDTSTPPSETSASDTDVPPPPRDSGFELEVAPPVDAGMPCARTGDCPGNWYCSYPGCGVSVGECRVLPTPGPYYDPVCGCDGTTFWNKEFAYVHSVAIAHEGLCTNAERKACTALGGMCDTPDSLCVVQLAGASSCAIGTPIGSCWRLPTGTLCGTAGGPPQLTCASTTTCYSLCQAVKLKKAFYPASCTPI